MATKKTRKQIILDTVSDAALNLVAYARREDEELPLGAIEESVEAGEITVDEIVEHFRKSLLEHGDFA